MISTIPLDQLLLLTTNLLNHPDSTLPSLASQFLHSSSHIIGIGLAGLTPPHLSTKCWLYFPEPSTPFYRCTIFSNYSKYNVPCNKEGEPEEMWSIMVEVSESAMKPVDEQTIVEEVVRGLIHTKLITLDDIILSRYHRRLEYGYPTPFLGRDSLITPINSAYESVGIYSRGRFGSWLYEVSNQDHSLMIGVEAVDRIVLNAEEVTINYPAVVNANKKGNNGRKPSIKGTVLERKEE